MSCIFIYNNDMITSKSSKHLLVFTAMCHHNTNKPQKYVKIIPSPGKGLMNHYHNTQATGRSLFRKASVAVSKWKPLTLN